MFDSESLNEDSFYVEASAINTYLYCPRRCYYEYVQNEREEKQLTDQQLAKKVHGGKA